MYVSDVVSFGSKNTVYVGFPAFRSSSGIDRTVPWTYVVPPTSQSRFSSTSTCPSKTVWM